MKTLATVFFGLGLAAIGGCGGDRVGAADSGGSSTAPASTKGATVSAAPRETEAERLGLGKARVLKDTPFDRAWDLQFPHRVANSWINPNIPDLIFFQMEETNEIYAVEAASGNTKWVTIALPKPAVLTPYASRTKTLNAHGDQVANDDRLWVISDDTLYSFDAVYGQVVWRWDLPFSPSSGVLALGTDTNQRVFLGDWDGRLQVVSYQGEKRFPYVMWQMNLRTSLTAPPVESDGLVYAADHAGVVHCFKYDREEVWSLATGAAIFGSPLPRGRLLYVGSDDNQLLVINRLSGQKLGALFLNGPIKRQPFAFRGEPSRVYAWLDLEHSAKGGLYAVKAQGDNVPFADTAKHPLEVVRMAEEWSIPGVTRLVGSNPQYLFLTAPDSTVIQAVDRASGKVAWTWDANEEHHNYLNENGRVEHRTCRFIAEYQDASDSDSAIYTADETGHVIAYRVFGDKPGDPLTGGKIMTRELLKAEKPADTGGGKKADGGKAAADPKAADPAAEKAPADKPAADATK